MTSSLVTWIVIIWGACGGLLLFWQLLGAIRFDIRDIRAQRHFRQHPFTRRYRSRPLVSVVVMTHNSGETITACLQSVLQTTYRKYEVLVVDQFSKDNTRKLVRQMMKQHPKWPLQLLSRRGRPSTQAALQYAYKKARGDLLLVLEPAVQLEPEAIASAVTRCNLFPEADGLLLHSRYGQALTVTSLFFKYYRLIQYRSFKARSAGRRISSQPDGTVLLRRSVLDTTAAQVSELHIAYAPDAIALAPSPMSFWRWLVQPGSSAPSPARLYAYLTPLALCYFLYLAVRVHQPTFLLVAWGVLVAILISAVWNDDRLLLRHKLAYLLGMPLVFGFYFLSTFGPWAALIRSSQRDLRQFVPTRGVARA